MQVIQINLPKSYIDGNHVTEYGVVNGVFKAQYGNSSWYCNTTKAIYSTTNDTLEKVSDFVLGCTPKNLECYTFSEFRFPEDRPYLPEDTLQWLQNRYNSLKQAIETLNIHQKDA